MKEKTVEVKNKIIMYIAEDGTEFKSRDECERHEDEVLLNRYADKYKMNFISVPTFICNDDHAYGVSFNFPQDGDKNEVIRLLSIYQNYHIDKECDKWEIDFSRNFSNVRNSDLNIEISCELNKGDDYIFYYCWERDNDDWDYFYNQIVSKEKAMTKLKKEISEFEKLFNTERNKENTKTKETITKLNCMKENGWHYVKDELPRKSDSTLCELMPVFVAVKVGYKISTYGTYWNLKLGKFECLDEVYAWCYTPEPPELPREADE